MNFAGKNVIVTGAASGIGRATALLFAEHHANVVITDINGDGLEVVAQEIRSKGVEALARVCDVSDEARVGEVVDEAVSQFGQIHVLVNNAGIYRDDRKLFVDSRSSNWRRKIDINILGTMYVTHAWLANMIPNRYGRIINLGSVAGVYGLRNMVDYSMTKGAIIAFTAALAKEMGAHTITVNTVSPGNISEVSRESDMSFLGRSGTPRECANLICFLASDEAAYISGQNYQIDGSRKFM